MAVMLNQYLWTAGYAFTSGGFLAYWASHLGAEGFEISLILAMPDLLGAFGLLTPLLLAMGLRVKTVWWTNVLFSRSFLLAAFLLVSFSEQLTQQRLILIALLFALSQITQSLSFVSLLSWLPQLDLQSSWGRLFASTQMAKAISLLIMPPLVVFLRSLAQQQDSAETLEQFYLYGGILGITLQLCSTLPLLWLKSQRHPPEAPSHASTPLTLWQTFLQVWQSRESRLLLLGFAWLSAFQGLTQAPFYLYQIRNLGVGLTEYFLMAGLMYGIQAVLSPLIGRLCDRGRARQTLLIGLFIASTGVAGYLLASREMHWPVWLTYTCWGMFAAVNIAGQVLIWNSLPEQSHPTIVAWFRMLSSTIAGLFGLLGGLWLDYLIQQYGITTSRPYLLLISISLAGRYASLLIFQRLKQGKSTPAN